MEKEKWGEIKEKRQELAALKYMDENGVELSKERQGKLKELKAWDEAWRVESKKTRDAKNAIRKKCMDELKASQKKEREELAAKQLVARRELRRQRVKLPA